MRDGPNTDPLQAQPQQPQQQQQQAQQAQQQQQQQAQQPQAAPSQEPPAGGAQQQWLSQVCFNKFIIN